MGETTCKVFTPLEIVKYMLDKIGYIHNLYGKKILENSCGTGHFLGEITRRYIIDARKNGKTDQEIKQGLERDVYGIEKEKDIYDICLNNLDNIAAQFGIKDVKWNVQLNDALKLKIEPIYQFVVGNPPYITYYNMPEEDRKLIKSRYDSCKKGKADYYYAFTEAALEALASDGVMAYLIPNNFMKNRYSEGLRKYILPYLIELEDFKFERIFEGRLTSSAIIVCSKRLSSPIFLYIDREKKGGLEKNNKYIVKNDLEGKWVLDKGLDNIGGKRKFGDCFKVSAPVATLLNKVFVIKDFRENEKWIEKGGYRLEKEGLRPAASPKSMQYKEKNYIIFPYYYEENKLCRYDEEQFLTLYPQIAGYLKQYAPKLSERKVDKNSKWFEFGRSQALAHINQEKIMLSTLITGKVKYYRLDKCTVPYSGMYLVPKEGYTIEQAEQVLDSEEFFRYIQEVGIHANGKTYRVSPRDIENYVFEEKW